MEPDPIGLEGGLNPYSYVSNNPVNNVDLTGLMYGMSDGDMGNFSLPSNLQFNMMNSIDTMNRFQQSQMNSSYSPIGTGTVLAQRPSYSSNPYNLSAAVLDISFGGNYTPIKGGGASAAVFLNTTDIDAGIAGTLSKSTGFGLGAGLTVDYYREGYNNYEGKSNTATACAFPACISIHNDGSTGEYTGKFTGLSLSLFGSKNGGALPAAMTVSHDNTYIWSIQRLVNWWK